MADKTIKHFVMVQFFTWQNPNYPHNVLDVDFLSSQVSLTQNIFRSLENQTNKNFELIFRVHKNLLSETKYEPILLTLKNSTTLPLKFSVGKERRRWIKEALNNYDYVITSRMDFDDFIYKDAVADTQSKIKDCDKILAYGYCKGYRYVYGELYSHRNLWGGEGHLGIMQSLIVNSSFAKTIPFVSVNSFIHNNVKLAMENFLENNGVKFTENMFEQNTMTNAYIYYRHNFSQQLLKSGNTEFKIPKHRPLTTADITKKQLEEEFGFFRELNSIK